MPWKSKGRKIYKKSRGRWKHIATATSASNARRSVSARYRNYKKKRGR